MSWVGAVLGTVDRTRKPPVRLDGRIFRYLSAQPRVQVNQHPVRTVMKLGGPQELAEARKERELFMQRRRQARRKAKARAYARAYRKKNAARIAANKKRWRQENREHVRAYHRRYEALNPRRRAYKNAKARQYRREKKASGK